jgi:hypothetical protein
VSLSSGFLLLASPSRAENTPCCGSRRVRRSPCHDSERAGTRESIGRPQSKTPGGSFHRAFYFCAGSGECSRALFLRRSTLNQQLWRVLILHVASATTARWQTKHQRPAVGCSANGSSYSACRDLESYFSCSFIYVRLAIHRNPGGNLRPYCSCENSQVWRRARRERDRDGRAGFRLHRSCARNYGHPAACQHDPIGSRAVTTTFH